MQRLVTAAVLLLLVTAASAGCSRSSSETAATQGSDGPRVVRVTENLFEPAELVISVGSTVEWIHEGEHFHTVTSESGLFDFHLAAGESGTFTFNEPGEFVYHCLPHQFLGMSGKIVVTQ